jgi:hypothetical protein
MGAADRASSSDFLPSAARARSRFLAAAYAAGLLYAGWADGFTTVVLGGDDLDGGSTCRRC